MEQEVSGLDITIDSKEGKIRLAVTDDGIFLEDCKKFGTSECDECQHKFKCYTQRKSGGSVLIGMPLKSIMDLINENNPPKNN